MRKNQMRMTATPGGAKKGPVGMGKDLTPHLDRLDSMPDGRHMADKIRESVESGTSGIRSVSDAMAKARADGNVSKEAVGNDMARQYLQHRGEIKPSILKDEFSEYQAKIGDTVKPRSRGKKA